MEANGHPEAEPEILRCTDNRKPEPENTNRKVYVE